MWQLLLAGDTRRLKVQSTITALNTVSSSQVETKAEAMVSCHAQYARARRGHLTDSIYARRWPYQSEARYYSCQGKGGQRRHTEADIVRKQGTLTQEYLTIIPDPLVPFLKTEVTNLLYVNNW